MEYIALYRKWRPMTFDEVVEQDSVVTILKNTVKSKRIAHAYLFCGTRGTGKTTLAKIFSRAINCLNPIDGNPCNQCDICRGILSDSLLDVSEIDAASNNGVDNIRSIIEEATYSSSKAEYKVFIIDEVHMLTQQAFNALLKTLEEPPENVVFILATTEPHKLPVTILSRCQRYDFKRISRNGIVSRLEEICHSLNIDYEEAALRFIAGKADGALRDAISILDQTLASASGAVTLKDARASSGSLDRETIELFAEKLILCDGGAILALIDQIFSDGRDPSNFICELIDLLRSMMVLLSVRNPGSLLYETGDDLEKLKKLASLTDTKELALLIKELSSLENSLKWSVQRKIIFESGMLSLCDRTWSSVTELADRVQYLERHLADLVANGLKVAAINAPSGTGAYIGIAAAENAAEDTAAEKEAAACSDENRFNDSNPEKEKLYDMSSLTPVEDIDWRDFLSAISDKKKPGISSGIKTHSKGYIIGNTLYIVFINKAMMNIVTKQNCTALLKECASVAFGKSLNISIEARENFEAMIPELKAQEKNEQNDISDQEFKKSLKLLKQISAAEGFTIDSGDNIEKSAASDIFFESDDKIASEHSEETAANTADIDSIEKKKYKNDIASGDTIPLFTEYGSEDIPPEDYGMPDIPPEGY